MDNYPVDPITMLVEVCFNSGKPNKLFRVWVNVTLKDLKDQLDQIDQRLNRKDTRRVEDVGSQRPSITSVGRLTFSWMMLANDNDVRSMFSIFGQHDMFPKIKMDASLLRSPEYIIKSLILPNEDV
jgi:hypothetical protein